jgi:hypothetical protein
MNTDREMCGVSGCQTYIGDGRYASSFADVCFTLNDGTRIARCSKCYTDQLYRTGKGQMSDITGRQPYLTPENVKAYWDKLDKADQERNAKRLAKNDCTP